MGEPPIGLRPKRLKSLDEFEPPYWKGLFRLRDRDGEISLIIVGVGFAIGVAAGLALILR